MAVNISNANLQTKTEIAVNKQQQLNETILIITHTHTQITHTHTQNYNTQQFTHDEFTEARNSTPRVQ